MTGKRRGHRDLTGVPTHDMTPEEYARSDNDKTYEVTTTRGTSIIVQGIHSARAVAGKDGSFKEVR